VAGDRAGDRLVDLGRTDLIIQGVILEAV